MRKVVVLIIMLFMSVLSFAQKPVRVEVFYDNASFVIDTNYLDNSASLQSLSSEICRLTTDSAVVISSISIDAYASPEGDKSRNIRLSERRADSAESYIRNNYKNFDFEIITSAHGVAWGILSSRILQSDIPSKEQLIEIIENVPEETWQIAKPNDRWESLVDSRKKHLMDLEEGVPYRYMEQNIFPSLRKATITINCKTIDVEQPLIAESQEVVEQDTVETTPAQPIQEASYTQQQTQSKKRRFAVKTNLLQLGVGVANVGVEFALTNNLTLDVPFTYSPYTLMNNWNLRILALQPEARFWLSESFSGHFVGAHAHLAYFNVPVDNENRYQNSADRPLWGFGLSYGYAFNIYKNLNLELNLGAGYASLGYDTYYNIPNGAMYNTTQKNYWGITRAGISIVYRF